MPDALSDLHEDATAGQRIEADESTSTDDDDQNFTSSSD